MTKWEKIAEITVAFTGIHKSKLSRKSKIEADLGITGDDATEYIEQFVNHFNIGYEGFDIGEYFGDEGFDPIGISTLYNMIFKKKTPKRANHELTLGDLENWAIRGYWSDFEPI